MIKTSSCKQKGRKLQQFVRDRIYHWFSTLSEGDVESRSMGSAGVDILLSPAAREFVPLSIECKNTTKHPTMGEIKQATANRYPDTLPIVAWKPHGKQYKDTLVMCKLEDLLELLERLKNVKEKEPNNT